MGNSLEDVELLSNYDISDILINATLILVLREKILGIKQINCSIRIDSDQIASVAHPYLNIKNKLHNISGEAEIEVNYQR